MLVDPSKKINPKNNIIDDKNLLETMKMKNAISYAENNRFEDIPAYNVRADGSNYYGQCAIPQGIQNKVKKVCCGIKFTAYLTLDTILYISGMYSTKGKFKILNKKFQSPIENIWDISAGEEHLVCIDMEDELKIYGSNTSGQTKLKNEVIDVNAIAAGPDYSIWAYGKNSNMIGSIGSNQYKQLDVDTTLLPGNIKSIEGFTKNVVIYTDNGVYISGDDNVKYNNLISPYSKKIKQVIVDHKFLVALLDDGELCILYDQYKNLKREKFEGLIVENIFRDILPQLTVLTIQGEVITDSRRDLEDKLYYVFGFEHYVAMEPYQKEVNYER